MIIKKLELENIRSYKKATVDFHLGTTLFEGDIGSGKSTILMAIEFGLFGLGNLNPASLLKIGEKEGMVELTIDVDGKEYVTQRVLSRKGKSIEQVKPRLKTPEGHQPLSVTEIKEKMLEILKFNEPVDPRATSKIYRYAVYTPQEDMQVIIFATPTERLKILRRAFRIEDYQTTIENVGRLSKSINEQSKFLDGKASGKPKLEANIRTLTGNIEDKTGKLGELQKSESGTESSLKNLRRQKDELVSDEKELRVAETVFATSVGIISGKNTEKSTYEGEKTELKEGIKELQLAIQKFEVIESPTDKLQEELNGKIDELKEQEQDRRDKETKCKTKVDDYNHIHEKGVCRTCDISVDPEKFKIKLAAKKAEADGLTQSVKICEKNRKENEQLLEKRKEYDNAQNQIKEHREKIKGNQKKIQDWDEQIRSVDEDIRKERKKQDEAAQTKKRLENVSKSLKTLEPEIENLEKSLTSIRAQVTTAKTNIESWTTQVAADRVELNDAKDLESKSNVLKEHKIWIDECFTNNVKTIEKQVMFSLNQGFNTEFQKWFSILVGIDDPSKEVRVDEDFTPFIQQDDYEQEIRHLSGGEKTSIALAYRLALNNTVQKVSTGMKSNLLILDEPTDGFSKDQLGKLKEILDELQSPQVILVSHEKELESFADQICRVSNSGESKIDPGT